MASGRLTAISIRLTIGGLAALSLGACNQFGESFDNGVVEGFRNSFTPSCTSTAVASGAPANIAQAICSCASDTLIAGNSADELRSLGRADVEAAMRTCAERSGVTL